MLQTIGNQQHFLNYHDTPHDNEREEVDRDREQQRSTRRRDQVSLLSNYNVLMFTLIFTLSIVLIISRPLKHLSLHTIFLLHVRSMHCTCTPSTIIVMNDRIK